MPYFDIFLLPSHKEGFPFVLLEAGKNKLPIITSDIPSLREVLQGGKYGTLISPTPLKIAETLHAHAKEKKHSAQKKAKNFSFAVEKYHTLEKMCEKTHSLYESGAGRPSSSLSASE
jgi:glycosyltransferase involved in cell wall biosynthesis